jgi:uncharacterized membrane protein YphA (DoxX/SURF4 family)
VGLRRARLVGDVENYTVTNALVLGYLAAALRFLDTERARLWPVAALLAAAVLFHLEALILGPSLLVLAATTRRRSGRDALGSVALVPTVLGLALWWFNDHGLPIGELLTHSQISADGGNWEAFMARPDLGYLWRQLQLLLLPAPTVVLLPALLVGRTPGRPPHVRSWPSRRPAACRWSSCGARSSAWTTTGTSTRWPPGHSACSCSVGWPPSPGCAPGHRGSRSWSRWRPPTRRPGSPRTTRRSPARKIARPPTMSSSGPPGRTGMTQTTATATIPTTTTAAPARPGRAANIGLWTLQVLTAAVFVFAAIPKITADPMAVAGFAMMGIGPAGMLTIGLLELAGAIAMFTPRLTGLAALCQVALMIGAVTTTLVYMDPVMAVLPAVVLVVVAVIAYGRRRSTVELIAFLRRLTARG